MSWKNIKLEYRKISSLINLQLYIVRVASIKKNMVS